MFSEIFSSIFKKEDDVSQKKEAKKVLEKGSEECPLSQNEFNELRKAQLKEEQLVYFTGYIDNSSEPEKSHAQYFNFVQKDSDNCSVNFIKSRKRIAVSLALKNKEDNSFETNNLSLLLKNNGKTIKEIGLKINVDLPMENKKELVSLIYGKLEDDFNSLTAFNNRKEDFKEYQDQKLRKELFFLIAAFIRKKSNNEISDASNLILFKN